MSLNPEQLVLAAVARADATSDAAIAAIDDIKVPRGSAVYFSGPDVDTHDFPVYEAPDKDLTAIPVYEPPTAPLPTAPVLELVPGVVAPTMPSRPGDIVTSDLFTQTAPNSVLPTWTETEPELGIDALVAEMAAIAKPIIQDFDFPALTAMTLRAAPTATVPTFVAPAAPTPLADPADYAAAMQTSYDRMLPEMQSFINDRVTATMATYCPGFAATRTALDSVLTAGLSGQVLPDQFEAALFTRAQGRAEREFANAEVELLSSFSKLGFLKPPGMVTASIHDARMKRSDALSNQATDVYVKRKEMEVQHLQFVMQLATTYEQAVFNLAVQYTEASGKTIQLATAFAQEKTQNLIRVYEHLIERSKLLVAVMGALNAQYETQLKAAMATLESYRLELEAEKAKKDVEIAMIKAVEAKINAQQVRVSLYTALIEAISRKGTLAELKMKGYQTRASIFETQVKAQVAGYDVYKAALEGDRAKLEGRMAAYSTYESQLKAASLELDVHVQAADSVIKTNESKVKTFEAGAEVYRLSADAAVNKFTQLAEIKKLAMSIYGTELQSEVEVFKAKTQQVSTKIDAILRAYESYVQSAVSAGNLNLENVKLQQTAAASIAELSSSIASSASGAINSMASVVSTVDV
jgi:hypothetical protein